MPTIRTLSPGDRCEQVARELRDRPGITAEMLAEEFGVSPRSIFRDLDRLRDRGFPVESSRGRGGGLRLRGNWGTGTVQLQREEALCTLLALAVAERLGLPMFGRETARARRKLAEVFPASERRRLAPLRERILLGSPASPSVRASYVTPEGSAMRSLQAAFVDERVVTATYTRDDGTTTRRRLEPHALLICWPVWYVLAHDHLRQEPRTFRLDRFERVEVDAQQFRSRPQDIGQDVLARHGVRVERV